MNIELDVHTHTIASGHAYSTLQEMVQSAADKGLKILGITEHGPTVRGSCNPVYFSNFHVIPRLINGVKLLLGSEINIINTNGDLDLKQKYIDMLDIRIAGIHESCYSGGTIDENTDALIKVMKDPSIDIISHPADGSAELHFEKIVQTAKENKILLEINNCSLNPNRGKEKAWDYNRQLVRLCKKYGVMVIMGSDAHISYDIANYNFVYQLFQEEEFPESLVINDKPDVFLKCLQRNEPYRGFV